MKIESNSLQTNTQSSPFDKMSLWVHDHPTTIKVLKIASLIMGLGLLVAAVSTAPFLLAAPIVLGITGALMTLAAAVAMLGLDVFISPHHDMKNHVFKAGQCEGGKLYYDGDVPILSLDSDDPHIAGKAHGYLCGDAINRLSKRFGLVLNTIARQPKGKDIPHTLASIRKTIPQRYLEELKGLVDGYNLWADEHKWKFPKKLTLDDALLLHLIPDSLHFQPQAFESGHINATPKEGKQARALACTAIVDQDPLKGIVFARNMDWPPFGLAGAYSLVIHRKAKEGLCSSVEVGIPGLVGTFTGMNQKGLSVAMNVCSGSTGEIKGMPAAFYNRACLEQCQSIKDVEKFIEDQSPLGPYHMTVADETGAESVHFYQSNNSTHLIRRLEKDKPLSTLNYRYNPYSNSPVHYSQQRQNQIDKFFQHRNNRPLEDALALPFVNNSITTHRVVMEPRNRTFKVAFDNGFAGKTRLRTINTERLFS